MDDTKTYENFKEDHRFHEIERKLKLEQLRCNYIKKAGHSKISSPGWPSCSSINNDESEISVAQSLQVSKIGSEVVSSSTNLRRTFRIQKINSDDKKTVATSSLKDFPINNTTMNDNEIMPPPKTNFISNRRSKRYPHVHSENESNNEQQNFSSMEQKLQSVTNASECSDADKSSSVPFREFSNWRVLLNSENKIIIKGEIQSGKIARSKPIAERLSCDKLLSIYNNIYILKGPMVDNRNELPDYVKNKFANGFPEDWINVQKLWIKYIQERSSPFFRWPTPVADSDDEINSEVTDLLYQRESLNENTSPVNKNNKQISISSGYSSNNKNFEIGKLNYHNMHEKVNLLKEDSGNSSVMKSQSNSRSYSDISLENSKHQSNNSFSHSLNLKNSYLHGYIKEDKLRKILSVIADENCPTEYVNKFTELLNILRYMNSFDLDHTDSEPESKRQKLLEIENREVQIIPKKSVTPTKFQKPTDLETEIKDNDPIVDYSESDEETISSYAGIPKMSLEQVLLEKMSNVPAKCPRHRKRYSRRSIKNKENMENVVRKENELVYEKSETENESYTVKNNKPIVKNIKNMHAMVQRENQAFKISQYSDVSICETDFNPDENLPKHVNTIAEKKIEDSEKSPSLQKSASIDKNKDQSINFLQRSPRVNLTKIDNKNKKNQFLFGSKENPKILASWIPEVVHNRNYEFKYGLIFKGNLINEKGQIVQKNYSTGIIIKNHELNLLETDEKDFIILSGECNNSKHVLRKELLQYCRNGCPSNIQKFINEWMKYNPAKFLIDSEINDLNTSIEHINVPLSSRGRKIMPRLEYWTGERIVSKADDVLYAMGSQQKIKPPTENQTEMEPPKSRKRKINPKELKKENVAQKPHYTTKNYSADKGHSYDTRLLVSKKTPPNSSKHAELTTKVQPLKNTARQKQLQKNYIEKNKDSSNKNLKPDVIKKNSKEFSYKFVQNKKPYISDEEFSAVASV